MFYKNYIKYPFEFLLTVLFILISSPILIGTAVFLLFANRGSIFFLQDRPGKNGKIFKVIKFKTMNDKRGKDGKLLPDHIRLTTVGKIVRATSIDEIPQLFNVLKGDMALIGPRPLLVKYLPLYTPEQFRRHQVRPGITGWAQVNGRNAISWSQKFEYDVWYVDNLSFWLDFKIFFLTLRKVLVREGINSDGQVTTEPFLGNEKK
ncbi:sugar transferase [Flavobacterium aurantiibacter]|uniref:Sugar transferase n=1 Tax=Flavobacterium aurantiibacter TaxID=2023067 RepID=A0A255ZR84_9FLAO|nr:sugar transferase [Flavobacterium aurantiibacter]OYQ43946.1 sugar transferase [Flavobacterium aurantiibacter]